jgi:hypothetical protein
MLRSHTKVAASLVVVLFLWIASVTVTAQELTTRVYLPLIMRSGAEDLDGCEPNGMPALACSIEPGLYQAHVSSPYDQDWYTFTIGDGADVTVRLTVPTGDNYDLYLYGDLPAAPIASSATLGDAEESIAATVSAGTYYILVFPIAQASDEYYQLRVEVQ